MSVIINHTGQPDEGQNYALICAIEGVDQLNATMQFQWSRVGAQNISQSAVFRFTPLTRDIHGNQYNCTVTITSPYLTGEYFRSTLETVMVTCKYAITYVYATYHICLISC